MNSTTESRAGVSHRARWVAAGFLGAFAASVATVIYTGLMVEGSPSDFDVGFRSVTLEPGEIAELSLRFEVLDAVSEAHLDVTLPAMLERVADDPLPGSGSGIDLQPGTNELTITIRAVSEGSGYVVARAIAGEPVALERVFVTVAAD